MPGLFEIFNIWHTYEAFNKYYIHHEPKLYCIITCRNCIENMVVGCSNFLFFRDRTLVHRALDY